MEGKEVMKTRLWKTILAILLLPVCANATTMDFYNDGTITDGNVFDTVNVWNDANVVMTGGTVYSVFSRDSSIFNLQSGDITGWITVRDASNLKISGGSVGDLELYNSAVAIISGGNITGTLATGAPISGTVHIYGENFELSFDGGWLIEGNWADETPFAIHYRSDSSTPMPGSPNSNIFLHTIPEPMTMAFLLIGISSIRKFRG